MFKAWEISSWAGLCRGQGELGTLLIIELSGRFLMAVWCNCIYIFYFCNFDFYFLYLFIFAFVYFNIMLTSKKWVALEEQSWIECESGRSKKTRSSGARRGRTGSKGGQIGEILRARDNYANESQRSLWQASMWSRKQTEGVRRCLAHLLSHSPVMNWFI